MLHHRVLTLAIFHSSQAAHTQFRIQLSTLSPHSFDKCFCVFTSSMFSKHQRPDSRDALHRSKRLGKNIAGLCASNAVSASQAAELLEDAAEGGVQDCRPFKRKRLAERNRSKNASRDLRAKLLRDSLWPRTYTTKARVHNTKTDKEEIQSVVMWLPHELVVALERQHRQLGSAHA